MVTTKKEQELLSKVHDLITGRGFLTLKKISQIKARRKRFSEYSLFIKDEGLSMGDKVRHLTWILMGTMTPFMGKSFAEYYAMKHVPKSDSVILGIPDMLNHLTSISGHKKYGKEFKIAHSYYRILLMRNKK